MLHLDRLDRGRQPDGRAALQLRRLGLVGLGRDRLEREGQLGQSRDVRHLGEVGLHGWRQLRVGHRHRRLAVRLEDSVPGLGVLLVLTLHRRGERGHRRGDRAELARGRCAEPGVVGEDGQVFQAGRNRGHRQVTGETGRRERSCSSRVGANAAALPRRPARVCRRDQHRGATGGGRSGAKEERPAARRRGRRLPWRRSCWRCPGAWPASRRRDGARRAPGSWPTSSFSVPSKVALRSLTHLTAPCLAGAAMLVL